MDCTQCNGTGTSGGSKALVDLVMHPCITCDGTGLTAHIHIFREAQDCDGRIDHYHTESDGDAAAFHKSLGWALGIGENTVTLDIQDGLYVATVARPTDEGWERTELRQCRDDCDVDERGQRDHEAEKAGY